jgi:uncharacterized protein (TIGR04255 family)
MASVRATREVYANAPVVLVAVEARHPVVQPITGGEQSELKRLIATSFPLPQPMQTRMITAPLPGGTPTLTDELIPRFATRDQTTAVTFNAESVVVETTSHRSFEHLAEFVRVCVEARQEVAPVAGLLRLGLRYIDEIRVPELHGPSRWGEWVAPSLVAPAGIGAGLGLEPEQWQGVVGFDRGSGRQLMLRYGPREGFAVMPGGPLQRATPPPGMFFLLDIDSYWTPAGEVPEFTAAEIVRLCADLHEPVSDLFESLITERLREEVLRNAGGDERG